MTARVPRILRFAFFLAFALTAAFVCNANSNRPPEKIYVDKFGGQNDMAQVRSDLIDRLRHSSEIEIVNESSQADAVLAGDGAIWVRGHINNNPRAAYSDPRPVYAGYLSVRLLDKGSQTLWSYLVVPKGFSDSITGDLAGQVARLIPAALSNVQRAGPSAVVSAGTTTGTGQTLKAAGGTFPAPLYQRWFESYSASHSGAHVDYAPIGSVAALDRLAQGEVDFAASDIPPGPEDRSRYFASVLGAVVPIYNVSGLSRNLRFTPETLAGIYLGRITRWNDRLLRAANGGLSLPDAPIKVVHRADGSGTTFAFTSFLARTVPEWKQDVGSGSIVQWPRGTGADGNEGVARKVEQTPNSIGYVELTYAIQHQLSFGSIRNEAGNYIQPDLNTVALAAAGSDGRDPIVQAAGKYAYPITSFTWIVFPARLDPAKKTALLDLMQWMLTQGQKQCAGLGYAPLPRMLADRQLAQIRGLR